MAAKIPGDCTPDLLLAFINRLGHMPTMQELIDHFGGLIGPLMDAHTLKEQGRLPSFPDQKKRPRRQ